jgi:hypothetical protein
LYIRDQEKDVKDTLLPFIKIVQEHYNLNSYHSFEHAVHVLCNVDALRKSVHCPHFTSLEWLALLFAALIHDLDHLGVPNFVLVADSHPYALLYNDRNVAEMRSLTLAFDLLSRFERNFYSIMHKEEKMLFRKLVIDLVLSTDMADKTAETLLFDDIGAALAQDSETVKILDYSKPQNRLFALIMILKTSDLGAAVQSANTSLLWTEKFYFELSPDGTLNSEEYVRNQLAHYNSGVRACIEYTRELGVISEEIMECIVKNLNNTIDLWSGDQAKDIIEGWKSKRAPAEINNEFIDDSTDLLRKV